MKPTVPVMLATEDALSEAVGLRLIAEHTDLEIGHCFGKRGCGYLKDHMEKWLSLSRHNPVILFTDLDRNACPTALISDWLGKRGKLPSQFLFRIAVRETESWLLADNEAIAEFLGIAVKHLPHTPDALSNPKAALLGLVGRSKNREIRHELLPEQGSTAKVGLGYNTVLSEFVRTQWSVERAMHRSPSLASARSRIRALANTVAVAT